MYNYPETNDFRIQSEEIFYKYQDRLPETEKKIYEWYYKKDITQKQIAKLLGITQGAVSSRLSRLYERLRFLTHLDSFDISNIDTDLKDFLDPLEIEILKTIIRTTCQQDTARIINNLFNFTGKQALNQVKLRHRVVKIREKLSKYSRRYPVCARYYKVLTYVNHNLYMMYELKLPHLGVR